MKLEDLCSEPPLWREEWGKMLPTANLLQEPDLGTQLFHTIAVPTSHPFFSLPSTPSLAPNPSIFAA